jgi:hypothetical protein
MKHTEWEAQFSRVIGQLKTLGHVPPLQEVDQIVVKNVLNPHLTALKTRLVLEIARDLPDASRTYSHTEFRVEAMTLAQTIEAVDLWGVSQGDVKALYGEASGGGKRGFSGAQGGGDKAAKRSSGGITCYRCGGPNHSAKDCEASNCALCGTKLVTGVRHNAQSCSTGASAGTKSTGAKVFAKGGGGKAKKPLASGGGKGAKTTSRAPLPDARTYSNKELAAFSAHIAETLADRAKSSATSQWGSEDGDGAG